MKRDLLKFDIIFFFGKSSFINVNIYERVNVYRNLFWCRVEFATFIYIFFSLTGDSANRFIYFQVSKLEKFSALFRVVFKYKY